MPAVGEDGCIYALIVDADKTKRNVRVLDLRKTSKKGRKAYVLTDDGEDWLVREIAMGASIDSLAAELGVDVTTLYSKQNSEKTKRAIKKGSETLKNRLRRAQVKSALSGNTTMLVWLGKNILGQSDRVVQMTVPLEKVASEDVDSLDLEEMRRIVQEL